MPILFSAIACNKKIKSKYASCDGNFMEIIDKVISKLPPGNAKMTYFHGHYLFHYILENAYLYFCVTDKSCQRSRAFLFLNEIQRKYESQRKEEFADVLAAEMYRYSEDYNTITIRKGEIDELNSIAVDSSESILGEKILFVNNTENLNYISTISLIRRTPEKMEISTNNYPTENLVDESSNNSNHKQIEAHVLNHKHFEESTNDSSERSYGTVIVILILILGISICTLEPKSCIIVTCIFILYFVRFFVKTKT